MFIHEVRTIREAQFLVKGEGLRWSIPKIGALCLFTGQGQCRGPTAAERGEGKQKLEHGCY